MIFVSVGTQLPFDRLIRAIDRWAKEQREVKVLAQCGPTDFVPTTVTTLPMLTPTEFDEYALNSAILVAHAGIGSILTALKHRKPIIIMPRSAALGEHRNEHQLATAERFRDRPGVHVADDEHDLVRLLDSRATLGGGQAIADQASDELLLAVRHFIDTGELD